ncbi:MAG TPA: hypothetical protein VKB93_18180 [Thermoanaerobaculia bacterium]|nr:hypothetical protein [Thermoanaerobaculia bacterium]
MKRALFLLLFALPLAAAEPFVDAYKRGVDAVNSSNYKLGASELQKAIAIVPGESTALKTRSAIITYVPHFWLGIAKYNLGDVDGAMREWRISEEQGAIGKTEYYATMKNWVARAQAEKKRLAQGAASGAKKSASDAISAAVLAQTDALSASAERTDNYRNAVRMLQDANAQYNRGGTDIDAYTDAAQKAARAAALFNAAAEEARRQKAARPPAPKPQPKPVPPKPDEFVVPFPEEAKPVKVEPPKPQPQPVAVDTAPPPPPVITKEQADAAVAEQEKRRTPPPKVEPKLKEVVTTVVLKPNLSNAFRAFATGDLTSSEQQLTDILASTPSAEAYLLRGCARYTRAMLSRTPDALLNAAVADFKAALQQNRALRLDSRAFSPKLIAYFEDVRNGKVF